MGSGVGVRDGGVRIRAKPRSGWFRAWGLGFRIQSLECGVRGLGFGAWLGFGVQGLGFGVWNLGFEVWGLGFETHLDASDGEHLRIGY